MDVVIRYLSLAGSVFSTLITVYFWFVKWRRELPNLKAYIVDREIFLGNMTAEQRQLGLKFGIIVANYSYLPNALLGVRLALKLQGENKWLDVEDVTYDQQTPMPFNLPGLQTALVRVNAAFALRSTPHWNRKRTFPRLTPNNSWLSRAPCGLNSRRSMT
ncbi:MAG TPA: hypothetical protein VE988_01075 [Gemmataceae bacterium]|nr:hypothetical protein [Gemmataceae bacterium]